MKRTKKSKDKALSPEFVNAWYCDGSKIVTVSGLKHGLIVFPNKRKYTSVDLSYLEKPGRYVRIDGLAFCGFTNLRSILLPYNTRFFGAEPFRGTSLVSKKGNYKAFKLALDGRMYCCPGNPFLGLSPEKKYYTVGKKSIVRGDLALCENGIHYCTNLFDVFNYYSGEYGKGFVIAECEVSKENIGGEDCEDVGVTDSKRCARWIIPTKVLSREEVINILNGEE